LLLQQIVSGLMLGGIYVTVAVAFTLTIGVLNFLNFTIPAIFMITGMVAWGVSARGLPFGLSSGGIHWLPALALGILAAVAASLIVERFTFRYLKTRHGDATEHAIPLVSSLGFLLIFEHIVLIAFGSETYSFTTPLRSDLRLGGLVIGIPQLVSLLLSLGLVALLSWILKTTKTWPRAARHRGEPRYRNPARRRRAQDRARGVPPHGPPLRPCGRALCCELRRRLRLHGGPCGH
jgi:branched-chain amino acid transport system permease protein